MTQDVEMKEQQAPSNSTSSTVSVLQHLKEIAALIETGAYAREVRRILRAVRLTIALRRKLKASVISSFLGFALAPGSEAHQRLSSYLPKDDQNDMEVDTASSATQTTVKHSPELEIYCYLLVLIFLIDQKKYNEAKACSSASIARLKNLNRRTVDVLASRLYFFYSLSYELTDELSDIRGSIFLLCTGLLHCVMMSWGRKRFSTCYFAIIFITIYMIKLKSSGLRHHALKLIQISRTIQLEYTDAKESLLQAARKAPVAALGFRVQCNKWAVIVRLLLGEIPERTVFMQKGMEKACKATLGATGIAFGR
ncbi:hypothetical protein Hanom_Chr15g01366491 [Helianthus anomalus]